MRRVAGEKEIREKGKGAKKGEWCFSLCGGLVRRGVLYLGRVGDVVYCGLRLGSLEGLSLVWMERCGK